MDFNVTLLSFFVSILVANALSRLHVFAFLKERPARFETLDGLRGFLALSVFVHHFVITYYWKSTGAWARPPQDFYQNFGKVGVALFFVITGFLFSYKILHAKERINWLKLFESRLFRIFPLYLFAVLLISLIVFHSSDYQLYSSVSDLLKQYVKWGIFEGSDINDFEGTRRIVAGVDWSLRYEWLFYISLPLLSIMLSKSRKYYGLLILSLSIALFLEPTVILSFKSELIILFAMGGFAAYLVNYLSGYSAIMRSKVASLVGSLLFGAAIFYPETLSFVHVVIISLFFMMVLLGNDLFGLLRLRSSVLLGEISYSIYLLHGIVLYLLFTQLSVVDVKGFQLSEFLLLLPLVSALVVIVSAITYLIIERPSMTLGRRYILTDFLISSAKMPIRQLKCFKLRVKSS